MPTQCCKLLLLLGLILLPARAILSQERQATPAVVHPPISSPLRSTIRLRGAWDFAIDPKQLGDQQKWFDPAVPLPGKTTIQVPGCWEAQGVGGPGKSTAVTPERSIRELTGSYVGTAWYRRAVPLPTDWTGKQVWLKIGGVHAQGWFWVNGTYVGHNDCYCGTYKYNITDLVKPGQPAVVVVKVRNDVPSGKGVMAFMQRFGGLYRDVEIEATPDVSIDDVYVQGDLDKRLAAVRATVRSEAALSKIDSRQVEVAISTLDGVKAGHAIRRVTLADQKSTEVTLQIPLNPFEPWSPDRPKLYKAEVTLLVDGKPVDGWVERFGVRKWETRGGDFYLNNHKFFVRGFGDDYIYPLTLCSPASHEFHRQHLQTAKRYGFVYIRQHTHCEVPEYFEAADELGLMIQPELPYYGARPSAGDPHYFRPKQDLEELYRHYRRYASFGTYCTGNEGNMGAPLDRELYQLAKRLDPTRLAQHQDGGHNTPENSDFRTGPWKPWKPGSQEASRPFFAHEYLNLATDEDPRLEAKYTGALRPPVTAAAFEEELKRNGLSREWGLACLDAGYQLKKYYQQQGLENARLDPACDGYIYWTIADVGFPYSAQGLLDQFWQPKATLPKDFHGINGPTALLARMVPDVPVMGPSETRKIEWWVSHFDPKPISRATLYWRLDGLDIGVGGANSGFQVAAGEVKKIGETVLPNLPATRPEHLKLEVTLPGISAANTWDLWIFPDRKPHPGSGNDLLASKNVFDVVAARYPGAALVGTAQSATRPIVLTDKLDADAVAALEKGKTVLLLKLDGPKPGVQLGWWMMSNQRGTAVARHPAFGDFPHDGYLSPLFFRLVDGTVLLNSDRYRGVEPLMVGHGKDGYLAYIFQARAGRGKILATGLRLLDDVPEGRYLLDRFLDYVRSEKFTPKTSLNLEHWPRQSP